MSKLPKQNIDTRDELLTVAGVRHGIRWIITRPAQERPVLVFLHDALGSIAQWKEFPEALALKLGLNALLIERQGHGHSSTLAGMRSKDYLHHQAYEVLPQLLSALQVERPILIGHSDGGTIAMLYAARFAPPAIISIAAHIFVEDITISAIKALLPYQAFLKMRLTKYHGDKTEALFRAWAETWISEDFRDFNIAEALPGITAPTLLIQSKDDEYGTELQLDGIMKKIRSEVKKVCLLEDGGHMLHLTRPQLLVEEISEFLSDLRLK